MSTGEYYPSTSWSDNWLWKAFTSTVHTICQNTAYRNQLFLMAFHQNSTHLGLGLQKDLNEKQLPRQIESSKFPLTLPSSDLNLKLGLSVTN